MPLDYQEIRRRRMADERPIRLTEPEAEWLAERRAQEQERQEQERHQADVKAFARFASDRAEQCKLRGDRSEATWRAAAENIGKGFWSIAKVIRSDCGITRFAELQTRLNYNGANIQLTEE